MWEKVWIQDKAAYGGDYHPKQRPEETWEEDTVGGFVSSSTPKQRPEKTWEEDMQLLELTHDTEVRCLE